MATPFMRNAVLIRHLFVQRRAGKMESDDEER